MTTNDTQEFGGTYQEPGRDRCEDNALQSTNMDADFSGDLLEESTTDPQDAFRTSAVTSAMLASLDEHIQKVELDLSHARELARRDKFFNRWPHHLEVRLEQLRTAQGILRSALDGTESLMLN